MFEEDLQLGEEKELIVAARLNEWWNSNLRKNPNKTDVDLIDGELSVEVKYDRKFNQTNNIAIEFLYKGKPSGLTSSSALHWSYMVGDDVWVAPTSSIKEWLRKNVGRYNTTKGGDNDNSLLALLSFPQFKEIFVKVVNHEKIEDGDFEVTA